MTSSKVWIRISAFALLPLASAGAAEWKFPCPENEIARYTAYHVAQPIRIDGRLDEPAWQRAPRSPRFRDILTGRPVIHDTRASVLWDDENLYIAYRVEEPLVHAKLTTNNSPIYTDNDVEFFVAGRDAYYEFEINAFNTTYEAFFIWADAYERGGFAQAPEFPRLRLQPFNGVDFKTHPRGGRLGHFNWHFPGKQTAVSSAPPHAASRPVAGRPGRTRREHRRPLSVACRRTGLARGTLPRPARSAFGPRLAPPPALRAGLRGRRHADGGRRVSSLRGHLPEIHPAPTQGPGLPTGRGGHLRRPERHPLLACDQVIAVRRERVELGKKAGPPSDEIGYYAALARASPSEVQGRGAVAFGLDPVRRPDLLSRPDASLPL